MQQYHPQRQGKVPIPGSSLGLAIDPQELLQPPDIPALGGASMGLADRGMKPFGPVQPEERRPHFLGDGFSGFVDQVTCHVVSSL